MNTLYVPCLSNYFMKFLLIKKKKNSVWLKRKRSVTRKGKDVLVLSTPVRLCVFLYPNGRSWLFSDKMTSFCVCEYPDSPSGQTSAGISAAREP